MNKGIDVSDNQGVIDWVKVKEDGVRHAVLRSVRRSGKVDYQFHNNVAGCRNVNLPFDVYKYSYATTTAEAIREAAAVVKLLKDNQIQCMVWWDMEDKSLEGLGKNVLTQLINAAKMIVETAGFSFGLYCNLNWYNNVLDTANYTVPFWVARYPSKSYMDILKDPNEEKRPQIKQPLFGWQYTDKGMVKGIKGNVDLNVLYGGNAMKTGKGMVEYTRSKLGTPYFYGAKFSDGPLTESKMATMRRMYPKVVTDSYIKKARLRKQVGVQNVDCSGLIAGYREKSLGSSQLYSSAYTRLPISKIKDFAPGTVLWKSGHVGVYIGIVNGIPMCREAKGIDYGTIESKVSDTSWKYGLTFLDLDYTFEVNLSPEATWKGTNPYEEPINTVKFGNKGDRVKWVQWELIEAGFGEVFMYNKVVYEGVKITGDADIITDAAIRAFQASSKIDADGKCGPITRKYWKNN